MSRAHGSQGAGVRVARSADARAVGGLLHDFNSEYDDYTPGARALAERVEELMAAGELTMLLAGAGPDGLAALRFRPAIFTRSLECYLAELYVRPGPRRRGLGRGLMEAAIGRLDQLLLRAGAVSRLPTARIQASLSRCAICCSG